MQVSKWLRQPGEQVKQYDILFELETEVSLFCLLAASTLQPSSAKPGLQTLTEPQNKIGDMEGSVTMLVESQVSMAALHAPSKRNAAAATQHCVQEDVFLQRILVDEGRELEVGTPVAVACEFEESLEALKEYTVPSKQDADKARTLSWQSYLQSGTETPGGCS